MLMVLGSLSAGALQRESSLFLSSEIFASEYRKNKDCLTSFHNPHGCRPFPATNLSNKIFTESKKVINIKVLEMQHNNGHIREDVKNIKDQLIATATERNRALDELKEIRKIAHEANMRLSVSAWKNSEINSELHSAKQSLSDASRELDAKQKDIEYLEIELYKKDAWVGNLNAELNNKKEFEVKATKLLTLTRSRILELESELETMKRKEEKAHDLSMEQAKKLDETRNLLEIASLQQKLKELENSSKHGEKYSEASKKSTYLEENNLELLREVERLQYELLVAKGQSNMALGDAEEEETQEIKSSLEARTSIHELEKNLEKMKEHEMKMHDSFTTQEKQLEQTKILVEESKLEIDSLRQKLEKFESSPQHGEKTSDVSNASCLEDNPELKQETKNLKSQLLVAKDGKEPLSNTKGYEAQTTELLTKARSRIQELEVELEKRIEYEGKVQGSFVEQKEQLRHTKTMLQKSMLEISSLKEILENLETSSKHGGKDAEAKQSNPDENHKLRQEIKLLESELLATKNELKMATEAEENSKHAMDDLVSALKEVATEAMEAKENLNLTQIALMHAEKRAEKHQQMAEEAGKESENCKKTAEMLRFDAEESALAWNEKVNGFVNCIKQADEEKMRVQQENAKLQEMLRDANITSVKSKEESNKLRDIIKQALNESSVAKEAARTARAENSQLKDDLTRLFRQNESLKENEAALLESNKKLKQLLSVASSE